MYVWRIYMVINSKVRGAKWRYIFWVKKWVRDLRHQGESKKKREWFIWQRPDTVITCLPCQIAFSSTKVIRIKILILGLKSPIKRHRVLGWVGNQNILFSIVFKMSKDKQGWRVRLENSQYLSFFQYGGWRTMETTTI